MDQAPISFHQASYYWGNNVLIHCLAGAHRAGTTGVLTLMYFMKLSADEAHKLAVSIRPVINPISDFPDLLELYEKCQKNKMDRETQAAGGGGGGGMGANEILAIV